MLALGRLTSTCLASWVAWQGLRSVIIALLLLSINRTGVLCQELSDPLVPTESYKAAMAPFTATRSQPDDLTDADKVALGIGIARAAHDCTSLSNNTARFSEDSTELFALGQLCIFGQQFEPARVALVRYLAIPQPLEREQALVLLVRAFLGLNAPDSAEPQIQSLLHDYPYDASIHMAIDAVIDRAEASDYSSVFNNIALRLCQTQTAATLPILIRGKALEGKDSSVSASALFRDAVRCAALARASDRPDNLSQLAAVPQQSNWAGTADLAVMQTALRRQQMVGAAIPLPILRGKVLGVGSLIPRTVSLTNGTALLVPFTLWSPSTPEVLGNLVRFAPQQSIYAITNWRANSGREDESSRQVLDQLRSWQLSLPRHVSILIVPDAEFNSFAADTFPAGILVRDGRVLMNSPLSGNGEQRLLLKLLTKQPVQQLAPAH